MLISPGKAPAARRSGEKRLTSTPRSQRPTRARVDPQPAEHRVARLARRQHDLALPVEHRHRRVGEGLQHGVHRPDARVGPQLGVVAAEHRQVHDPRGQQRGDAGRAGRADVHEVVAALGQRLDDRRDARDADLQPLVERDLDLGDRAEAAVGDGVGRDDLDLEARDAAVAQLLQRVRDAVHPADAVGDQRDAARRAVLVRDELRLLLAQERGGRRVGDRGDAGVEEVRGARRQPARAALADAGDRRSSTTRASLRSCVRRARRKRSAWRKSSSFIAASRSALERCAEADRVQPRAQQRAGVLRAGGRRPSRRGAPRPRS